MSFDLIGKAVKILHLPTVSYQSSAIKIIHAQEGDANSRFLSISLFDDRGTINLDNFQRVVLNATLPDGSIQNTTGELNKTDKLAICKIASSMLSQTGKVACDITLTGEDANGNRMSLTSQTFYVFVAKSQVGDEAIEGSDNYTLLVQLLNEVSTLEGDIETAEEVRFSAEQARVTAEDTRASNETARVNAENARVTVESERKDAESSRLQSENKRKDAETTRTQAEAARANAENGRVSAETARAEAEVARETAEVKRETDTAAAIASFNGVASQVIASAEGKAQEAAGSAQSAANSANASAVSAQAAESSAERAGTSEKNAEQAYQSLIGEQFKWMGEYNVGLTYHKHDCVRFNGSVYIALKDLAIGVEPAQSLDWDIMVSSGADGTTSFEDLTPEQKASLKGDKGDTGAQGEPGQNGQNGQDGYTPVKGTDYFTDTDIAAMVAVLQSHCPTIYGGTSTPDSSLGKEGDVYIMYDD